MTPDSDAEKAAIDWANDWAWDGVMYWKLIDYAKGIEPEELLGMQFAVKAHLAGQKLGFKNGYYTALARVQSAFRKIWEKEKAAHPDNIDGYGIVLAMNGAIEDLKTLAAKEVQDGE